VDELRLEAPLSGVMADLWTRAQDGLGPDADHTEMFRFLESLATRESR
jgi:hypothetical protein